MSERDRGLYAKYRVERISDPDGKHSDCWYFVLDPQHDPIAREALRDYAVHALSYGYYDLYRDLDAWLLALQSNGADDDVPLRRSRVMSRLAACPTCSWPNRSTSGLRCETCGTDYGLPPEAGEVAVISMMGRAPQIALFDGEFWRSYDTRGPIKCVEHAATRVGGVVPLVNGAEL